MQFGFSRRSVSRSHHKSRRAAAKRRRLVFDSLEDRRLLSLTPPGTPVAVDSSGNDNLYYESTRAVAMDSAGDAVVAWSEAIPSTGNFNLMFERYTNTSGTLTPQGAVTQASNVTSANLEGGEGVIMVARAPTSGDFVVVWDTSTKPNSTNPNGTYATHAQLYSSAGTPIGGSLLVGGSGNNLLKSVTMNDTGFDVLYDALNRQGYLNPKMQRYSFTPSSVSAVGSPINTSGGMMAMDAAGDFVVVWNSTNLNTDTQVVDAELFSSAGAGQGVIEVANSGGSAGGAGVMYGDVAMDSAGNFVVDWWYSRSGYDSVEARQFTTGGIPLQAESNPIIVAQSERDSNGHTTADPTFAGGLAETGEGAFDISWPNNTYYRQNSIDVATYDPSGNQLQMLDASGVTSNGMSSTSLAVDANSDLFDVWSVIGDIDGDFYLQQSLPASQLAISAPANVTVGVPFNVTVTAEDANGAKVPSDNGTVTITDGNGVLAGSPVTANLTNGVGTASVTLNATGSDTLTASGIDPSTGNTLTGSSTVNVFAAPTQLVLSGIPAGAMAGSSFTVTVTAKAGDSIAQGDSSTVQFSSSDGKAALPASVTLSDGAATFTATLKTAGNQTITAADSSDSLNVTSGTITVSAAAASQFILSAPSTVTSGTPFTLTITAVDAYGNVVSTYPGGPVQVTSGGNTLASGPLTNGVGTFSLTLTNTAKHHRPQQQTITVTDGSITTSLVVTVD
ncbi:MAG: hypothetical protein ACREHD_02970 [Pirellulales bacterium]